MVVTRAYLLGLAGHALLEIASRSFYARQDAITPLIAAILNIAGYIVFATWFSRLWGIAGIALGNTVSFTLEAMLLFFLLNRKVPGVFQIRGTILRVGLAAIVGGVAVYGLLTVLPLASWSLILSTVVAAGVLLIGGVLALPFIWTEVKVLVRL